MSALWAGLVFEPVTWWRTGASHSQNEASSAWRVCVCTVLASELMNLRTSRFPTHRHTHTHTQSLLPFHHPLAHISGSGGEPLAERRWEAAIVSYSCGGTEPSKERVPTNLPESVLDGYTTSFHPTVLPTEMEPPTQQKMEDGATCPGLHNAESLCNSEGESVRWNGPF